MVEFANALAKAVEHPLAFVHMPVPIERDDDAFFKPFAGYGWHGHRGLSWRGSRQDGKDGTEADRRGQEDISAVRDRL